MVVATYLWWWLGDGLLLFSPHYWVLPHGAALSKKPRHTSIHGSAWQPAWQGADSTTSCLLQRQRLFAKQNLPVPRKNGAVPRFLERCSRNSWELCRNLPKSPAKHSPKKTATDTAPRRLFCDPPSIQRATPYSTPKPGSTLGSKPKWMWGSWC